MLSHGECFEVVPTPWKTNLFLNNNLGQDVLDNSSVDSFAVSSLLLCSAAS